MRIGKNKIAFLPPGAPYTDSLANHKLLLDVQLSGSGRSEVKIIPRMLTLTNNPMTAPITLVNNKTFGKQ
jgi:hypothetical protein